MQFFPEFELKRTCELMLNMKSVLTGLIRIRPLITGTLTNTLDLGNDFAAKTDGWTDGRMDTRKDRWTDATTHIIFQLRG